MALVTGLTIYTSRIAISMGNRALSGKRYSTCSRSHLYSLFMVSLSSLATLRGCRCEMSTVFLSAKLANQKLVGGNVNRCSLDSFPSLLSLQLHSQATCTVPDIRLETLYIDFVLQIRLEIRFPLLVDVSEPDVQIRRHILSSQCQCLTC